MKKLSFVGLAGALLALLPSTGVSQSASSKATLTNPSYFGGSVISPSYDNTGLGGLTNNPLSSQYAPAQRFDIAFDWDGNSTTDLSITSYLFCIQLEQSGVANPHNFETVASNLGIRYGAGVNSAPVPASERETQLRRLFQAVFPTTYAPDNIGGAFGGSASERATAFQVAVWNIIYGGGLSLSTGAGPYSDGFGANDATISPIVSSMLTAAGNVDEANLSVTLWALRYTGGNVQDYVVPFYGETPGATTPEPATYALLVGVATLGVVSIRRRFKVRA